ncbi:ester cyclase [Streptomyces deccanensis]|uniref:ester cyclase n=1 Tax=Streptomyces deccanensis TaxID=424188 RepID=UPI001EFB32F5|nr:ester cyclase [Streptomyces deccanensis]ULR51529.1 ester cyclase [Streptomyces deccanensis]
MAREDNIAVLKQAVELINSGDAENGVHTLFSEDAVDHDLAPGQGPGRQGLLEFFAGLTSAFPDLRLEPRHISGDEDHVSLAFTVSGTHRAALHGIPPTGRRFEVSGVEIFRFAGGQVVERWGLIDDFGILTQLGLVQPPSA